MAVIQPLCLRIRRNNTGALHLRDRRIGPHQPNNNSFSLYLSPSLENCDLSLCRWASGLAPGTGVSPTLFLHSLSQGFQGAVSAGSFFFAPLRSRRRLNQTKREFANIVSRLSQPPGGSRRHSLGLRFAPGLALRTERGIGPRECLTTRWPVSTTQCRGSR